MQNNAADAEPAIHAIHVAPSPHLSERAFTTRRMMVDVLIGLAPLLIVAVWVFRWHAGTQIAICVVSCLAAEGIFTAVRRKPCSLCDCSAVVTGIILAFSLPGTAPWYVGVIGSFTAIGLGKIIFGGLGMNIFNPAMVGRAFVMIAFTSALAGPAYRLAVEPGEAGCSGAITQATPMTVMQKEKNTITGSMSEEVREAFSLRGLLLGNVNGSIGETSALACLIGGAFLCLRRTAAWQIPLGAVFSVLVIGVIMDFVAPSNMRALHHLLGGALLFGAFFIATDPVSSPLTPNGRLIFGMGFGALVMLMRTLSAYPEGVMFSVLLMNAVTPLINRWTIPKPVGGPVPVKK